MERSGPDRAGGKTTNWASRVKLALCLGLIALGVFGVIHLGYAAMESLSFEPLTIKDRVVYSQVQLNGSAMDVSPTIWWISVVASPGLIIGLILSRSVRRTVVSGIGLVSPWIAAGWGSLATLILYLQDKSGDWSGPTRAAWDVQLFLLNNPMRQGSWALGVLLIGSVIGWAVAGAKPTSRPPANPIRQRLLGLLLIGIGTAALLLGLQPDALLAFLAPPRRYHFYYIDPAATRVFDNIACLGLVILTAGICLYRLPSLRARLRT